MKIQIIGGSGFVGSRLISIIGQENCLNLDKNQSPFFSSITTIGDIRNPAQIKMNKKTKCVILLAAEHKDNVHPKSLYYDVNVDGTKNVLDQMDKLEINNLIFTSSVAIYGLNKINPSESHPEEPFNDYGKSKFEAEKVIFEWFNKKPKKRNVIIIRPTVIFGERNRGNVYNLLKQISSGNFLMVGNGKNKKSMAYVGNVAAFIKKCIEDSNVGYNIFNYSDKPDFDMQKLVSIIEKKMNVKIPNIKVPYSLGMFAGYLFDFFSILFRKSFSVSSVRIKKFCATTQFNSKKVHNIFIPPYSLQEGLNKTLDHEFINPKDDDVIFYSE